MMRNASLACALLLGCVGCVAPALTSRPVQTQPSWFVRLDSYVDPTKAGDVRYDHPATWTETELDAILGRLLVQERGGLLDPSRSPRALLTARETGRLTPHLVEAFRKATSAEWVSFFLGDTVGSELEVTSGGFFVLGGRLHVVLANHRERVAASPEHAEAVRANPLRPLRGPRGSLTFEPSRFVVASQAHWSTGGGPAGSELILDHREFLDSLRPPGVMTPVEPLSPRAETSAGPDEIEGLKQKVQGLESELARLKQRLSELEAQNPASPNKNPAR